MTVHEVIEAKRWRNVRTNQTASLYGAVPYTNAQDQVDWIVESVGYTWRNSNGTIGLGRVPAKTRQEAQAIMDRVNARRASVRPC